MILDMFRLDGKSALVTGCRTGIGFAVAQALAEAGADIIGVSRALTSGSEIEKAVTAAGRNFRCFDCNFEDRGSLYNFIEKIKADPGPPDILFNNAGTIRRAPVSEYSDADWDKVVETNLNSQFILTRELGREMLKKGAGKIVFTCSLLSYQGGINVPAYAASKGGIARLVQAFANEWAPKGINVNGIAPGYIETSNTEAIRADKARSSAILSRIPAGRWGVPEDIAGAAVFLASSASDYINGSIIAVDGGWLGR